MKERCGLCHWTPATQAPLEGWIGIIQGYLDHQPHPDRVVGLIPCDRKVFEDESWFCVVAREPFAEGHIRLVCRDHISDLSQLRGYSDHNVDQSVLEAARSTLLDDLIIAHDVALGYDSRVTDAVVLQRSTRHRHLFFDIVPVYRFDHGSLQILGEASAMFKDMSLPDKRKYWKARVGDFVETSQRLRDVAGRVIRSRPGRRRAGLVAGDE